MASMSTLGQFCANRGGGDQLQTSCTSTQIYYVCFPSNSSSLFKYRQLVLYVTRKIYEDDTFQDLVK